MNKHEWIKNKLINALDSYDDGTLKLQVIEYINEAEATEKVYQELQRDVKKYFKNHEIDPISDLAVKLFKVGVNHE